MKKYLSGFFIASFMLMVSCGPKPEEQVRDFAERFAGFVVNNQKDSIQKYYPDFLLTDSLIPVLPANDIRINVLKEDEKFNIEYRPDINITVTLHKSGNVTVESSFGLFAFSDSQIALAEKMNIWDSDMNDVELSEKIFNETERRNNFTSPDLYFFNLHGPVKTMIISYTGLDYEYDCFMIDWSRKGLYQFNEMGEWINYMQINPEIRKIERNSEGFIIKICVTPEYDDGSPYDIESFGWTGNRLTSYSYNSWESGNFSYTDNVVTKYDGNYSNTESECYVTVTLMDFKYDEMGNWISCLWKRADKTPDYDFMYAQEDYNWENIKYKTTTTTGTMKRDIEYY